MIFLAILVALIILAAGFGLSVVLPRWVNWQYRSATMVTIWIITALLAISTAWGIA